MFEVNSELTAYTKYITKKHRESYIKVNMFLSEVSKKISKNI